MSQTDNIDSFLRPRHPGISDYFARFFPGKVRKIAVNAGLGCPGRCTYCNNSAFSPSYSKGLKDNIPAQIEAGIKFNSLKGEVFGYLVYFQSYTNTYGDTEKLIGLYEQALSYPGVKGLVIATRPDCLESELLDYLERRFGRKAPSAHPFLLVEIGVESTTDPTLERIRRGHDWACSREAILELDRRGIPVGAHLILGLPGETEDDFLRHVRLVSELPVSTLKLHQLQIIRSTPLAAEYEKDPSAFHLFTPEEYASLIKRLLPEIRPDIALDRFVSESPLSMVIAPSWGLKPEEFTRLVYG